MLCLLEKIPKHEGILGIFVVIKSLQIGIILVDLIKNACMLVCRTVIEYLINLAGIACRRAETIENSF